jgi:hypothetical protein
LQFDEALSLLLSKLCFAVIDVLYRGGEVWDRAEKRKGIDSNPKIRIDTLSCFDIPVCSWRPIVPGHAA